MASFLTSFGRLYDTKFPASDISGAASAGNARVRRDMPMRRAALRDGHLVRRRRYSLRGPPSCGGNDVDHGHLSNLGRSPTGGNVLQRRVKVSGTVLCIKRALIAKGAQRDPQEVFIDVEK